MARCLDLGPSQTKAQRNGGWGESTPIAPSGRDVPCSALLAGAASLNYTVLPHGTQSHWGDHILRAVEVHKVALFLFFLIGPNLV
jgi:hypothetical protein